MIYDLNMQINRRSFLGGAAALAAAPRGASGFAQDSPIKLGVATYSLRKFSREKAIAMIKELNVEYVDIKEMHLPYKDSPEQLAADRKEFDAAGLKVVSGGNNDMKSDKEPDLRKFFDYAKAAGLPMLVIAPSRTNMGMIEKLVKEYDIKVAIHNHGPEDAKYYPTPQSALEVIKGMDPRVGLCIDIGHTSRTGKDIVESVAEAGPRLLEVHMKDLTDPRGKDSQVAVGDGVLPIPALFRQLRKMNYKGVCSLEYEVHADDPLMGMAKSFSYMRGVIAGMTA